jgi:hypothetical protein
MGAKQMHSVQFEKAPPAADSPGAVQAPVRRGTEVSAGRRRARAHRRPATSAR